MMRKINIFMLIISILGVFEAYAQNRFDKNYTANMRTYTYEELSAIPRRLREVHDYNQERIIILYEEISSFLEEIEEEKFRKEMFEFIKQLDDLEDQPLGYPEITKIINQIIISCRKSVIDYNNRALKAKREEKKPSFSSSNYGLKEIVLKAEVNVRKQASFHGEILRTLVEGTTVWILEKQGEFYKIKDAEERQGWVWEALLK